MLACEVLEYGDLEILEWSKTLQPKQQMVSVYILNPSWNPVSEQISPKK